MDDLISDAPTRVAAIAAIDAAGRVPIDDRTKSQLEDKVDRYVAELLSLNVGSPDFAIKADKLAWLGQHEIATLADRSNFFFGRSGGSPASVTLASNLASLRTVLEKLDPARNGNLLAPRRILGIIPAGPKLKQYFDRYASAQAIIETLLRGLSDGRDALLQDNIAIDNERRRMCPQMGALKRMIYLAGALDSTLENSARGFERTDSAKANAIRDRALLHVRQRRTDLLAQMAVAAQAYMALDLIRKNNTELIEGADRASKTTIAALRTAVTVARALVGQRLVLDQIAAVHDATVNLIDGGGALQRDDDVRIVQHHSPVSANLDTLQRAFANVFATMAAVDSVKVEASGNLDQTIASLSAEIDKANRAIERPLPDDGTNRGDKRLLLE